MHTESPYVVTAVKTNKLQQNKKIIHLLFKNTQSNAIRFSAVTDIYVKARPGKRHTKLIKLFLLGNGGENYRSGVKE